MSALILIVDDSATLRSQIKAVLRRDGNYQFVEAGDGLTAFKLMSERQPDLVLCDLVMPNFDGLKLLAMRSSRKELAHIPVLMLTAESDTDRKVEILQKGASDYVTKPFHEEELLARVRIHLRLKVLQDELRETNARLEALSVTDGLTGLFNRRYLDRVLLNEVARTARYQTPMALMLVDIDHFKEVNDNHGHAMGDEVLRNVGRFLGANVRTTDIAARYGGEEFVIIMPNTPLAGGMRLAERLLAKLGALVHTHGGASIHRTASFGVASQEAPDLRVTPEELLQHADEAMFAAKQQGRNRVMSWPVKIGG